MPSVPVGRYVYGEDAEPFTFSFFTDVSQSPAVIKSMLQAQHEVCGLLLLVGLMCGWVCTAGQVCLRHARLEVVQQT